MTSAALIADAVHSLSDVATDLIALFGIRLSSRPADESHPYGHGRLDSIAASLVGTALIIGGGIIAWRAVESIIDFEERFPGYPMLLVAAISIVSKEWMYRATRRVARRTSSPALSANAWHHRSDALSSVAVFIGGAAILVGWGYGDQAAALVIGLMVAGIGANNIWKLFQEFSEGSISREERRRIENVVGQVPGILGWHQLRTRMVGREIFMDIHVLVDPDISLSEAHDICSAVEQRVSQAMDRPTNVIVHCEPVEKTPPPGKSGGFPRP